MLSGIVVVIELPGQIGFLSDFSSYIEKSWVHMRLLLCRNSFMNGPFMLVATPLLLL